MKGIILAAGQGNRMGSVTKSKPKCMIKYNGKAIIDYIIQTFNECGINDIIVINGYKKEILENHLDDKNISFITNENYNTTNMLYSLFCAESQINDDIIISYSDIIYNNKVLKKLMENKMDIAITVDNAWRELWEIRMEDPLQDAETMKIDKSGFVLDLGKKPSSYDEINGQYIGLIKISKNILPKISQFYHNLDKQALYEGQNYYNMYMTTFMQLIIDNLCSVKADIINGGWLEFDTVTDLNIYKSKKLSL